jgi:hypothetical protein
MGERSFGEAGGGLNDLASKGSIVQPDIQNHASNQYESMISTISRKPQAMSASVSSSAKPRIYSGILQPSHSPQR